MTRLADKICLITAAASGIGAASARMVAEQGAKVIALDVDRDGLSTLASAHVDIEPITADVRVSDALERVVTGRERIDVLFNCAGTVQVGSILECSEESWAQSMDLNVTSIYRAMRAVLPGMLSRGNGSIINMASVISSIGAAPARFAYGASKAAVIGMTRSVSRDYAQHGIRCNAICPSAVDTPSMNRRIEAMLDPEAARAAFAARQPVGRMASADEIAHLAVYLASDESRFTTGASIVIDGGTWA